MISFEPFRQWYYQQSIKSDLRKKDIVEICNIHYKTLSKIFHDEKVETETLNKLMVGFGFSELSQIMTYIPEEAPKE